MTVRASIAPASLRRQVAVRPLDDDLVGLGEARAGGEDGPGVAHGDVVAEERAVLGDRGGEVDRAEDQHPRWGANGDEHLHALAAALAVGTVGQGLVRPPASSPRASSWTASSARAEPSDPVGSVGSDDHAASEPRGSGCSMTVATATGRAGIASTTASSCGKVLRDNVLDVHVEDAAAGQPDGEGVVVGDAVALEAGYAGLETSLAIS